MHYSSVKTSCTVKRGWFGEVKIVSKGSLESDIPGAFDKGFASMDGPLRKTNEMLYDYYREGVK